MMGFCGNRDNALSVKEGVIRNECYIDVLNLVPHGIFSMFSLFILIVWNRSSLGNMEAKTWSKAELKGEQPSFHKIYLRAFWPILALAGLLRLFGDMLAFVGPWCVEHVVAYAYKETKSRDLPVPLLTNQNASLYGYQDNLSNNFTFILNQMNSTQSNADNRVKKCNEMIQSMRVIKLLAWEKICQKTINQSRKPELWALFRAAVFRIFFKDAEGFNTGDKHKTHTIGTDTMEDKPMKVGVVVESVNGTGKPVTVVQNEMSSSQSSLESNLSRTPGHSRQNSHSSLKDIMELKERRHSEPNKTGKLTIIVGSVGSGKTSLLSAMLGEIESERPSESSTEMKVGSPHLEGRKHSYPSITELQHQSSVKLPNILDNFLGCLFTTLCAVIVNTITTPYFLLAAIPLFILYYLIQLFFRAPAR
ncbi:ABCC9 [Mytilus edulis]|uniref:ABCC9 n=1 Tax=Mytilus edulis TaxID=6550 RepID=A0A8S3PNT6_MYTED|nr:ABCC9 [Mytilus edulis]